MFYGRKCFTSFKLKTASPIAGVISLSHQLLSIEVAIHLTLARHWLRSGRIIDNPETANRLIASDANRVLQPHDRDRLSQADSGHGTRDKRVNLVESSDGMWKVITGGGFAMTAISLVIHVR